MAKERIYRPRVSSSKIKDKIKFYYLEKFFNLWMNKFDFKGLNYQQKHYIMKKFWSEGSVACSSIYQADPALAGLIKDGTLQMGENDVIFTPWAFANRYNIYDFPTHLRLINTRGVAFITNKILEIDKEAVIVWAQMNHKSVFSSIEAKINELVDIEMKKRIARKAQSQPWMFAFSPEDFAQAKIMEEQLENDEPYMFVPFRDVDKAKGFTSGAPYVVDKFEQDRQKVENDILTMMGINNVGVAEKKEHFVVDEVNANNENIDRASMGFESPIKEGFERINACFNKNYEVIDQYEAYYMPRIEEEEQKEEDEDVSNLS